jgi:hypothetical protein
MGGQKEKASTKKQNKTNAAQKQSNSRLDDTNSKAQQNDGENDRKIYS